MVASPWRVGDGVVAQYATRSLDLAVARILFASYLLLVRVPEALWIRNAPAELLDPPPGLTVLGAFWATHPAILALNGLLVLFAALLLVGRWTRIASLGTALTILAIDSAGYAFGKIDHDILLVLAPLTLAFSGWGEALSLDAQRRGEAPSPASTEASSEANAWTTALLALLLGWAMFSSGARKALNEWLDPDLWCTYGHLVRNYLVTGRETWAGALALGFQEAWFWKLVDWGTLGFELGFLFAVLHRGAFRVFLAIAALFHLGVHLLFDITFAGNVIVYAVFVPWGRVPLALRSARGAVDGVGDRRSAVARWGWVFLLAVAAGGSALAMGASSDEGLANGALSATILLVGAAIGLAHLLGISSRLFPASDGDRVAGHREPATGGAGSRDPDD